MGVPSHLARAGVRVSLGPSTTESEIDRFIEAWIKVSGSLPKQQSQSIAA
jgi:cysteine desulfurase